MKEQSSNFLYFMVGVLAVAVGVLAYSYMSGDKPVTDNVPAAQTGKVNPDAGDRDITGSFEQRTNNEGIE